MSNKKYLSNISWKLKLIPLRFAQKFIFFLPYHQIHVSLVSPVFRGFCLWKQTYKTGPLPDKNRTWLWNKNRIYIKWNDILQLHFSL